jgi:hypothetical protein
VLESIGDVVVKVLGALELVPDNMGCDWCCTGFVSCCGVFCSFVMCCMLFLLEYSMLMNKKRVEMVGVIDWMKIKNNQ